MPGTHIYTGLVLDRDADTQTGSSRRAVPGGHNDNVMRPAEPVLLKWLPIALLGCTISGCTAAPLQAPSDAGIAALTAALSALGPRVDPSEARIAALTAYAVTAELRASYRMVGPPPELHNILVNTGLRDRGLCCHWAEDTGKRLHALQLKTLDVHWVVANEGSALHEHNSAMLSAHDGPIANGIIVDGWRNAGTLYWGTLAADHYTWKLHPADHNWQWIHCQ